jgi:hypothetical protein
MVLTDVPRTTDRSRPVAAPVPRRQPSHPHSAGHGERRTGLLDPGPRTARHHHAAAVGAYLAISLVLWAHVWFGGDPSHAITCNCGDTVQQVWWFEWLPWALMHGHNPFLSNAMWARFGGVNAMSNTSWFFPSAVLAPITLLFGPVASFNLANLVVPVVSGWAAFVLAGRLSRRVGARVVAGGLYAFSPYVLRNIVLGHIDLTLTAYLPLVMLLGLRLLSRGARPVRLGLWLGLLTILEFFTSFEVLALSTVTVVLCAAGVLVVRPGLLWAARRTLVMAVAAAASVAAVVLAYPVWFYLHGPRHVAGPYWPVRSSRATGIVSAGPNVFNAHTGLTAVGYLGPQGPVTNYLGFGLLALVVISIPRWWPRRSCRVLAGVALVSWLCEAAPAGLWKRLPFLSCIDLIRFALPVSLCVALLVAASVDGWWRRATGRKPGPRPRARRRLACAGVVVMVGAAFLPLLDTYSVPFTVTTATVPAWFERDAPHLALGTAVLTIPFAYGLESAPMGWQAETGDTFALIGGWVFVPGGNGRDDEVMSALGNPVAALRALSRDPSDVTTAEQEAIRSAVARWRPVEVVVVPRDAKPGSVAAVTDTLGLAPTWSDGAWVWTVGRSTRLGAMRAP